MNGAWRLAARNLRRNRRRNLATGLAVAVGVAGLAILGGYLAHVERFLRTNAVYLQHGGHVVVYREGGLDRAMARPLRDSLTAEHQAAVREAVSGDPRVTWAAGYLRGVGLAGNGCRSVPFVALGIEEDAQRRMLAHADVLAYSRALAQPLRGRHLHEEAVTHVSLFLHDWHDAARVAEDLRARLRAAGVPADVYEFGDERVNSYYAGSMAFLRSMAGVILVIIAAVVVLGVMNATTLTVYERSRELGTLRALGCTRRVAGALVVREAALVTSLGAAAGVLAAYGVAAGVAFAGLHIHPPGVPGTMQVLVTPGPGVLGRLLALIAISTLGVAWVVVWSRLRQRTSDLLIATSA